jgi:hypothetical protein
MLLLLLLQVPPIAQKLTKAFEWVFHMGQNQVLDSDAMLLHIQVGAGPSAMLTACRKGVCPLCGAAAAAAQLVPTQ